MIFENVTDFLRLHDNKTTRFWVAEFVKVPNTRLRQAQSPEYLNPKKNHAALL